MIVIRKDEDPRVTSRGDLAGWFKANGCDALAREVLRRKVGAGEVLAYVDFEGSSFEVGFTVLDLRAT